MAQDIISENSQIKREQETGLTVAQKAPHWKEEQYYYSSPRFIGQANLTDPDITARLSEKYFPECFGECLDLYFS